jgi:hypothetical protein
MEVHLKKNEAAYITFPMVTTASPETFDTGETVSDTAYYKDGAGSWTSLAITDTVTEISTTGMYSIDLTASEMNHDLIAIKFTSTNAADTMVMIRTYAVDHDDLVRSTTPANTLDISATGEVSANVTQFGGGAIPTPAATGVPDVNVTHLVDSTASATSLKRSADGVIFGTASGSPTTTSTPSDLSLNGDDRVIDRTIVFLTGTGAYQAGKITDYVNSTGTVTWSQTFAVAPVSGDTFIIV